jgi:putative ABC transport system substrate-binding protein
MKRREFIALVGGAAVTWPFAASAQQSERMRRVTILVGAQLSEDLDAQGNVAAFLQTLQELGWTNGRNIQIEIRWAGGNAADISRHATELVALAPDVIFASGTAAMGPVATGDPHRADRVRERCGRCRRGFRR